MNITIKLGREGVESTYRDKVVDAFCVGDWATHNVFPYSDSDIPDPDNFTITHIPTGKCLHSHTGYLGEENARDVVIALANLGPMPTADEARSRKEDIVRVLELNVAHRCGPNCSVWREVSEALLP